MLEASDAGWLGIVEKVALVFLGWLLGWGTEFIREWRERRKLKGELFEELEILLERVKEIQLGYTRALQLYAHDNIDSAMPVPMPHPIYTNHYKIVCSHLTKGQRQSYETIHGYIDQFNHDLEVEAALFREFSLKRAREQFDLLSRIITAHFINVSAMRWLIQYHLENPDDPGMTRGSDAHTRYSEDETVLLGK